MEQSGSQLGVYRLYERIGGGGFASVYIARDTRTNEMVAVKVLHNHLAQDAQFIARFKREADVLQRMPPHPNIVRLHEFGQQGGTYYLAMEYLDGKDLSQILAERQRLSPEEARSIAIQVAEALDIAHRHGLVHRDIKPGNIKITPQGAAKVMDFGIVRAAEGTRVTQTGTFMGTPDYLAPEIWEGKPADIRGDIYALGVMLYEMLTGVAPFRSATPAAVMRRHLMEQTRSVRTFRSDIPENVERVVAKMMAKQPEARYQTPSELLIGLKEGGEFQPKTVVGTRPVRQPSLAVRRSASLPTGIFIGFGVLLAVVLIIGVFELAFGLGTRGATSPVAAIASTPTLKASNPTWTPTRNVPTPTYTRVLPSPTNRSGTINDPIGVVRLASTDPVHLAYMLVVSGQDGTLGVDSRRGVEIAIDDKGGKLLDRAIKLDGQDSGCNAEGGQAAAAKLAADATILGVIGSSCSSEMRAGGPALSKVGFTIISPSNTAPDLTDPARRIAGYFRVSWNDKVQGAAAAQFALTQLKVKTAATIHDGSPYAEGLANAFAENFEKGGGKVVAKEAVIPYDKEFKPVLTRIAAAKPEFLFYPIFITAGSLITKQAKEVPGVDKIPLMAADGTFSGDFYKGAGTAAVGMYQSSPDFSAFPAGYKTFLDKHQKKYNENPLSAFHAHAYDATSILFIAIEKVAVKGPDGALYIGRQALRDAVAATKDFSGITGNLTCDSNGDCGSVTISVYQVSADNVSKAQTPWKPVWTFGVK